MADTGSTSDLVDALRRLETTEAHLRTRLRRRFGVSNTDIIALQYIDRAERRGRTVQVLALAPVLGVTNSATTALVQRLEQRGHVTKTPDPSNHRARLVALTDSTRQELLEALEATRERIDTVVAGLDDLERARAIRLINDIDTALRGDDAPLTIPAPEPL